MFAVRHWRQGVIACIAGLLPSGLLDAEGVAPPPDPYALVFGQALEAARDDRWGELNRLEEQLGDNHPLQGYLDFHRLRAQLPDAPPERIRAYQREYAELPIADALGRLALRLYAENDREEAVRRLRDDPPPRRGLLKCQWWSAQLEERRDQALAFAESFWDSGTPRPGACNVLFDEARADGRIGDAETWDRLRRAHRTGSDGLVRHLERALEDPAYREAARTLHSLNATPAAVRELDRPTADDPARTSLHQDLIVEGLYALASEDTAGARRALEAIRQADPASADGLREPARRIAWYSIVRRVDANRDWVAEELRTLGDPELFELRVRQAVQEQDWQGVLRWAGFLPPERLERPRWQYWLGRARERLGDPGGAYAAYERAAEGRTFWGMAAADRLGRPYTLNRETAAYPLDTEALGRPFRDPAVTRVRVLYEIGELRLARDEWRTLLERSPKAYRHALAAHAHRKNWPELSVDAARRAGTTERLDWRFPQAYVGEFTASATHHSVDRHLLMAIGRRESSFNRDAHSGSGARGIMQLQPTTARAVSRYNGTPKPSREALFDPETNIALGAAYLARLLERFDGNRLQALAAYNAGPSRVRSWLRDEGVPYDVWVERIPYRETRRYVQAVLTYRVLYEAANGSAHGLSLMTEEEQRTAYGPSAPSGLAER